MEVKLEKLIEELRKEGVEGGQQEAERIIADARKKAETVIAEAEEKAQARIREAEKSAGALEENARQAVQHAVRDGELLLKNRLTSLFGRVFKDAVGRQADPDFLKEAILSLVKSWGKGKEIEVTVNDKDLEKLRNVLSTALDEKLNEGITLRSDPSVDAGFYIGIRDEDLYYDFSAESVSGLFMQFLSPKIKDVLEGENG